MAPNIFCRDILRVIIGYLPRSDVWKFTILSKAIDDIIGREYLSILMANYINEYNMSLRKHFTIGRNVQVYDFLTLRKKFMCTPNKRLLFKHFKNVFIPMYTIDDDFIFELRSGQKIYVYYYTNFTFAILNFPSLYHGIQIPLMNKKVINITLSLIGREYNHIIAALMIINQKLHLPDRELADALTLLPKLRH